VIARPMIAHAARVLLAFAVALALAADARAQASASLAPLEFLLGDWEAVGLPPGESGAFIFSLAVQERIIVRTNYAQYPARDGRPATRHDDLMVIFPENDRLKADYFDSEQHVIRYVISIRGPKDVMFLSELKPSEPRYRLTYTLGSDNVLKGAFDVSAPGAPDDFKPYLTWSARRLK
jgi:hypothetical protein